MLLRRTAAAAAAATLGGSYYHFAQRKAAALAEPAATPTSVLTSSIVLRDGRRLAFHTSGGGSTPVYAFHGMGSSHLTWLGSPVAELSKEVTLVAVDRPGYGDSSDPPACYTYSQWCQDLAQLADALGHKKFAVAGHSSGGPYALAAAALLPERVVACAAISSDPPYAHPDAPEPVRTGGADLGGPTYGLDPFSRFGKWRDGSLKSGQAAKLHAWKGGVVGFVTDFNLERLPWSFRIEDIALGGAITFWVGEKDFEVIKDGAPWMQSLVKGSRLVVVPGGDHGFKSKPEHLKAILDDLVRAARAQ